MVLHRLWSLLSMRRRTFFVLSLSFSALWCTAESITDNNDVDALLALRQSWSPRSILQWTGNDPCGSGWTGIKCDSSSPQRVVSIELSGLGLAGVLASDIGQLSALQTLDMSFNNLTGHIPRQIGQLTQLNALYLQSNFFNGKIPEEIGQLTSLGTLALNGNSLSEEIPNEIGQLSKLSWLDVADNLLEGPLPYSSDGKSSVRAGLDNLTNARHFHMNNNSFSGAIPESICHPGMNLMHLLLDSNQLVGSIPAVLGSCSNLLVLKLSDNQLQGTIPDQIGQLTTLTELQLSSNGLVGPLPDLSNLTNLGVLDLSNNPLGVEFPSWMQSLESLTDLVMQNASLSGQIPPPFFQLQDLSDVKLTNNQISGTLDITKAASALSLVSIENNEIDFLSSGRVNFDLRLQGNPYCTGKSVPFPQACLGNSSAAAQNDGTSTTCFNSCPSGFLVNPVQCSCAIPYQGILTYRAPMFTTLMNNSASRARIQTLVVFLANNLSVDQQQVDIESTSFDRQNQLIVPIAIFPDASERQWGMDDVIRLSHVLGQIGVAPPGFGPPMFKQTSYTYIIVSPKRSGLSMAAKIGIGAGVALLVFGIFAAVSVASLQKRRADKAVELSKPFVWAPSGNDSGAAPKLKGARFFSFAELKKATNNFSESNGIGSGGYGKVYRGIISSGEQVAVKRAQRNSMQGATEFKNEIELLSRVHHKNVVGLVGFCFAQGEQILVYEYMAGGSLQDCLTGRSSMRLDWRRRVMIALGAARGITYLHELVNPPIIHRDIKSTNILLDEKKIAKVADFGLSKIGPGEGAEKQHVSTQVKGTLGYLDPEYYVSQQLTEKSDVYSYGVVLLELLTARAPIEHGKYVVKEVKAAIDKGGLGALRSMLDPRLKGEELSELNAFVRIALSCVEEEATGRPSMGEVVKQLEEMVGHDYPESGSSNIDVKKGQPTRHTFGSDSDYLHTSRDSSDPSFPNSSSHVPPSFGSK